MTNEPPMSPSNEGAAGGVLARIGGALVEKLRKVRRRPSRRAERALLLTSFLIFVVVAVAGAVNFPEVDEVRWWLLLLAGGLGMPLNVILNAVEFQIIGRFVGQRVRFARATKVTVVGSAANMLPIPGSTLVRIQALVADEASYRGAITASVAVGIFSVGANLGLAGVALSTRAEPLVVGGLLGASALAVFAAVASIRVSFDGTVTLRWGGAAFAIEILYASTAAVRLYLILLGLGLDIGLPAAFALTAAGSLATAVGFFPGGLGIREVFVGLISPLVGVPVAAGMVGQVVTRLFWFGVLAVAALILFVREGRQVFRGEQTDEPLPAVVPPTGEL